MSESAIPSPSPDPAAAQSGAVGADSGPLAGIPDTSDPIADLASICAEPTVESGLTTFAPADLVQQEGWVFPERFPEARIPLESGAVANAVMAVGACVVQGDSDPAVAGRRAILQACRGLACLGAVPVAAFLRVAGADAGCDWGRGASEAWDGLAGPIPGLAQALEFRESGADGPGIVVLGRVADPSNIPRARIPSTGQAILLLGGSASEPADPWKGLGGSLYLRTVRGRVGDRWAGFDIDISRTLHTTLVGLVREGAILGARSCLAGGIANAVRTFVGAGEAMEGGHVGATLTVPLEGEGQRVDCFLFGETEGRVLVTVNAVDAGRVLRQARIMGVSAMRLGTVEGDTLRIQAGGRCWGGVASDAEVAEAATA